MSKITDNDLFTFRVLNNGKFVLNIQDSPYGGQTFMGSSPIRESREANSNQLNIKIRTNVVYREILKMPQPT